MKVFKQHNRPAYISTQIKRSRQKFEYCKVSINHVINWKKILDKFSKLNKSKICCLGTRNGREIDLFRYVFNMNPLFSFLAKCNETKKYGYNNIFPYFSKFNRSNLEQLSDDFSIGVEINPDAKREDVFVGSFDDLPKNWSNMFDVIYSNSFDQSQNPEKTAFEWKRVLGKKSFLILSFGFKEPTEEDPVGCLSVEDIMKLFPGKLIHYKEQGSNYDDIIIEFNE